MDRSCQVLLVIYILLSVVSRAVFDNTLELSYQSLKRLHQLQAVKDRILDGLRLDDVPNLPRGLSRPQMHAALTQLHQAAMSAHIPHFKDTVNLAFIIFSEPPILGRQEQKNSIQFKLTGSGSSFPVHVTSASLFVRMKTKRGKKQMATKNSNNVQQNKVGINRNKPRLKTNKARQKIGKAGRNTRKGKKIKVLVHHYSKRRHFRRVTVMKVRINETKWLRITVPAATIERDLNSRNKTILLRVTCKRCKQGFSLDLLYKKTAKKNRNGKHRKSKRRRLNYTRPFLVVHTLPSTVSTRSRRTLEHCPETSNTTQCCSRQLYVDFREIGWDNWILHPQGFTTSTCDGGCTSNPAHVITSNQSSRYRNATHQVACRPTATEPLTVVYYQGVDVVVTRTIPGLVDKQCGCV